LNLINNVLQANQCDHGGPQTTCERPACNPHKKDDSFKTLRLTSIAQMELKLFAVLNFYLI